MGMLIWITVVLFSRTAQSNSVYQPNSVTSASSGDNVTLRCFRTNEENTDAIIWYKQAVGHEPRVMVTVQKVVTKPIFADEFNSQRFTVESVRGRCDLKITNVEPSDEAVYYCGLKLVTIAFGKGTFLSVRDDGDVKVSVLQRGVFSVPAGASVTLQCSVLSERTTSQLQVLWFRAAPAQSHPQIIYTHHNSSQQCDSGSSTHTCVYNFSKNILSLNDTGTYYCAVVLCGKMLLGNGTRVQLEKPIEPLMMVLAAALGVCGILLTAQTIFICKNTHYKERSDGSWHDAVINTEQTNTQDCDSVELNYAALRFSERKSQRPREKRHQHPDSVYSQLKPSSVT